MNEAKFKTAFKKSVKAHKGFSLSLAAPMIVGIPDLYVVLPEYLPVLLEAKYLGEIKREKFSRKVPFTLMQQHWIQSCDNVSPYSAMGLVGFKYNNLYYAVLVKFGHKQFFNMSQDFLSECSYVRVVSLSETFDVSALFANVPIPKIEKINTPNWRITIDKDITPVRIDLSVPQGTIK